MQVNKRITITIGILGGLSALLYGAVVVPSIYAIRSTNTKIAAEHTKIERRYLLRNVTRKSISAIEDAKKQLRTLSVVGIREGDELSFISALESAASAANVTQEISLQTVN